MERSQVLRGFWLLVSREGCEEDLVFSILTFSDTRHPALIDEGHTDAGKGWLKRLGADMNSAGICFPVGELPSLRDPCMTPLEPGRQLRRGVQETEF